MSFLLDLLPGKSKHKRRSSSTPYMAAPLHDHPHRASFSGVVTPSCTDIYPPESADPDALTTKVKLLANAEVRRIISESLIESGMRILRPVPTKKGGDPAGNEEFNDIKQQALLKIQELKFALAESSEKRKKLQEEVKMLNPERCALKEGSFEESAPSPPLLQEALHSVQIALLNCSAMVAENVKLYIKQDHQAAIHCQLCFSLFDDFETSSFGGTQHGAGFQRPDKDHKRCLFQDFIKYRTVSELQLFTTEQTLFRAYYDSRFDIFVNRLCNPLPFASQKDRQSVLTKFLQDDKCPLFLHFASVVKAVWLLHKLAFACEPNAEIFRVNDGSHYDSNYMEVRDGEQGRATTLAAAEVEFMTAPGFTIQNSILKAQVHLKRNKF